MRWKSKINRRWREANGNEHFPAKSNSRNYANRTIKQERRIMFTIEREK